MRLLLAEDEEDISRALVEILKRNKYSVDAVYNGEDALDYLETELYDAAILDIMMPKLDGLTVLKKIRSKGMDIPVLLLTAKSEIDDRVAGLDAGADDYLTKPFAAKELLARVRSITRRTGEVTDNTLKFGNTSLDRSTFTLSGPDDSIKLSSKEFQMLEMLMTTPGQILSQDQFMDKVWGYDTDTEANVVWVYISYLRKKLAKAGSDILIKASRGLGYSLEKKND
ncbi:MAG: response regulator transcription factor [Lachnospiraceae bacterium]|nr:response regulator transcription factor [Lachnospiraceae bacterium]